MNFCRSCPCPFAPQVNSQAANQLSASRHLPPPRGEVEPPNPGLDPGEGGSGGGNCTAAPTRLAAFLIHYRANPRRQIVVRCCLPALSSPPYRRDASTGLRESASLFATREAKG